MRTPDGICGDCEGTGRKVVRVEVRRGKEVKVIRPCKTCDGTGELKKRRG